MNKLYYIATCRTPLLIGAVENYSRDLMYCLIPKRFYPLSGHLSKRKFKNLQCSLVPVGSCFHDMIEPYNTENIEEKYQSYKRHYNDYVK